MRLRKVFLVTFVALAVPVGAASLAYACTALATLSVTGGAAPGQMVTGTGKGFNGGLHGADPATATRTPVEMHWSTRTGPVMTSSVPDSAGNISFSFAAPSVPAAQYVLIGVQNDSATGNPYYGTPARQSVTIVAAAGRSSEGASAVPAADAQAAAAVPAVVPAAVAAAVAAAPVQRAVVPAPAQAVTSSAAPQATQAAPAAASTPPSAGQSVVATADPIGTSAAAVQSSASTASVTTATPGLISTSSAAEPGAVTPAIFLMLLGLAIGLAASAKWMTSRLPQLRRANAASA